MLELREFQRMFARALLDARAVESVPEVASLGAALRVHRNTVIKALVDALEANYSTVVQLVGREWFRACAVEYARLYPARSAALMVYGESFPAFLSAFAPAKELPYLAQVARIDRMWIEAYTARDAMPLPANSLARRDPAVLYEQRVSLHPATRFGWFGHSAAAIWMHHRQDCPASGLEIADCEDGLVLARALGAIQHISLDRASFVFLERLAAGETLGEAASAALTIDVNADIAGGLARFVRAGIFSGVL